MPVFQLWSVNKQNDVSLLKYNIICDCKCHMYYGMNIYSVFISYSAGQEHFQLVVSEDQETAVWPVVVGYHLSQWPTDCDKITRQIELEIFGPKMWYF